MKPLILITNDDGIYSPGIQAVAEAVDDLGELLIAAPITQQTSMGRAFPRIPDLGIIEPVALPVNGRKRTGYGVHASPAYTVAHAVLEIAGRKPDICISGINYGENIGMTLTCSGTLGACFEAQSHGIPALALSRQIGLDFQRSTRYSALPWEKEKKITRKWAEKLLKKKLPKGVDILNINIPQEVDDINDFMLTTQSDQNYFCFIKPEKRDFSKPFELQSQRQVALEKLDKKSDIYALYVEHRTSVTPVRHQMACFDKKEWKEIRTFFTH